MISPEFFFSNLSEKQSKYFFSIIQKIGKEMDVKKGTAIIRYGSHPSFFFYILSGAFKTSIIQKDKPYILGFTFSGDIDCCPASLLKSSTNNFAIEAVLDSKVLICKLKDFQKACSMKDYSTITTNILANYVSILEKRVIETISLTAEQRYHILQKNQPALLKEIPLVHIAAYLGITQERLSRIRKKAK
ncbi:MAG: Crp/Fnr family transcriptional regulator [Bacteroidota bacterium]|nr:Crp/Fnr family transcriptional regulator [Bacteroidota bacterium]